MTDNNRREIGINDCLPYNLSIVISIEDLDLENIMFTKKSFKDIVVTYYIGYKAADCIKPLYFTFHKTDIFKMMNLMCLMKIMMILKIMMGINIYH